MKKIFLAVTFIFLMVAASCCKNEAEAPSSPSQPENLAFEKEQYDLTRGSVTDIKVTGCEKAEFTVINEKIASIVSSTTKECRVEGKKEGATVIKAVSGTNVSKSILNVISSETTRNVKNDEWYICSFAYITEENEYAVETFFTEGKPLMQIKEDFISVKKENGNYIRCSKEKFMYLEYESYRG